MNPTAFIILLAFVPISTILVIFVKNRDIYKRRRQNLLLILNAVIYSCVLCYGMLTNSRGEYGVYAFIGFAYFSLLIFVPIQLLLVAIRVSGAFTKPKPSLNNE